MKRKSLAWVALAWAVVQVGCGGDGESTGSAGAGQGGRATGGAGGSGGMGQGGVTSGGPGSGRTGGAAGNAMGGGGGAIDAGEPEGGGGSPPDASRDARNDGTIDASRDTLFDASEARADTGRDGPDAESDSGTTCRGPLDKGVWRDLGEAATNAKARAIVIVGSDVLLATTVGLFRRPLDASAPWRPAGLAGKWVESVTIGKGGSGVLLAGLGGIMRPKEAPMFRSTDGGASWQQQPGDPFKNSDGYEAIASFTSYVRPGGGEVFFANTSGLGVARSTDGAAWKYVFGSPDQFAYSCELGVAPGIGAFVYQGCEVVLDTATVNRFGVDEDPVTKPEPVIKFPDISNRRPNVMASSASNPSALYAGVEGGLVKITSAGWTWLYQSNSGDDRLTHGYAYVRAVWVDPCATQHILFGGFLNGTNPALQLYESLDEGAHVTRIDAPASPAFQDIAIERGVEASNGRAIAFAVTMDNLAATPRARVLVREQSR